jgi:hypothetical protein
MAEWGAHDDDSGAASGVESRILARYQCASLMLGFGSAGQVGGRAASWSRTARSWSVVMLQPRS